MAESSAPTEAQVEPTEDKTSPTEAQAARPPIKRKTSLSTPPLPPGFVERVERMCLQCQKMYWEHENGPKACEYHPGNKSAHLRVRNEYDEEEWSCCGRKNVGTHPQYEIAPGCTISAHMCANDLKEKKAAEEAKRIEEERIAAEKKAQQDAIDAETARLAARFKAQEEAEQAEKAAAEAEAELKKRGTVRRSSVTKDSAGAPAAPVRRKSVDAGAAGAGPRRPSLTSSSPVPGGRNESPTKRRPSLSGAAKAVGLTRKASVDKS